MVLHKYCENFKYTLHIQIVISYSINVFLIQHVAKFRSENFVCICICRIVLTQIQ